MIALPALFSLAAGIWGITRDGSMWRDEAVTYEVAHRSTPEIWALVQNIDAVHGLYYVLMHTLLSAWDGGVTALRLPSLSAIVVATMGVAAIAQRLVSSRAGIVAGIAFAAFPIVQYHAQEGRSYALVTACVIWATWSLVRASESNSARWWALYTFLSLLACWLNLFAAFAVVAHAVTLHLGGAPRAQRRAFVASGVTVAIGTLPLAGFALGQSDAQLGWLSRPGITEWATFIAVLSAGLVLSAATMPDRPPVDVRRLALSLLAVPAGLLLVLSMIKPYYVDRYVLYGYGGLALLVGAAVDWAVGSQGVRRVFPRPPCYWAALAVLPATLTAMLIPLYVDMRTPEARKDNVLAVSAAVSEVAEPGSAILFAPARRRDWLLHDPAGYQLLEDVALQETPERSGTLRGIEYKPKEITARLSTQKRIIVLSDPEGQPLDQTPQEIVKREALESGFVECRTISVTGARISVWDRNCGPL